MSIGTLFLYGFPVDMIYLGTSVHLFLCYSLSQIKIDFPHYAIIERRAMSRTCRRDSKASTVTSYPLENRVYNVKVLALLSHRHIRHMAQCLIVTW